MKKSVRYMIIGEVW